MSSYSRPAASERVLIDRLRFREHRSIRRIAAVIGRSPSTVSRELRRNLWNPASENESYHPYRPARLKTGAWTGGPYYCASAAQRLAGKRRERCVRRRRMSCDRLVAWVMDELRRGRRIPIPARVPIHELPAGVESRREFGHWASDTVIGGGAARRCTDTQVERKIRFPAATPVDSKQAAATTAAEARVFGALPPAAGPARRRDNGSEPALHLLVDESTGILTYYADLCSSFQRTATRTAAA